jgi:hypothetical protein
MTDHYLFQHLATVLFFIALLHTFLTGKFTQWADRFKPGSTIENVLHLLGEIEIVFGLWSGILILVSIVFINFDFVNEYLNTRNFTEPLFVFVIMSVCSTKPILSFIEKGLIFVSKLLPLHGNISAFISILFIGPLFGSFITEPAAMTICAFLLLPRFFNIHHSLKFKYATMALLFVNISLGGTLTPYAAPPVLMVATKWGWDLRFMLTHFAPKTILTLLINTITIFLLFKKEIVKPHEIRKTTDSVPALVTILHFLFLALIVLTAHHSVLFVGLFLFFIGFLRATKEYQNPLSLKEPLLVGFFLAGLVVLGGLQDWWLIPTINRLSDIQLFFGSIGLTAITDNAALTYLGSLVPDLNLNAKLALVSGSVIGGGLTIIANAPNPAGFGILRNSFNKDGFSPLYLFVWALPLTIVGVLVFLIF